MKVVPVVAGCITNKGRVLIGLREYSDSPETIGMWEMLGGKVEEGETPDEALARELREELGLIVEVRGLLHAHLNTYSSGVTYLVLFYHCKILAAGYKGEGIETVWARPTSVEFAKTLPGTKEALNRLIKLGEYY